uniref:Uncharacterized protein n=1 Tax=Anguilla anguilla TaxID=7936 RepID=A0A0E9X5P0_ANGAN
MLPKDASSGLKTVNSKVKKKPGSPLQIVCVEHLYNFRKLHICLNQAMYNIACQKK